jgi:hypothetical protein
VRCIKCEEREVYISPKGHMGKLCAVCFLKAFTRLPNPDCPYCSGTGECYTHSPDCNDDLCALAGGYHDCGGVVVDCDCSILDPYNYDDLIGELK